MTPKDKGLLRELLHEYGPYELIRMLAKEGFEGYGSGIGKFLRELAQELDPAHPCYWGKPDYYGTVSWAEAVTRWAGE